MTTIEFLHGAPDRVQGAAQWLQKAWGRRQAVLVYVPDAGQAAQLDRVLWTQPQLSFLPHCRANSPLAAETPILLTDKLDTPPHEGCLLNLSNELPSSFSRFEHLVEIVSTDDADRLPARERFKFYRDRGYAIESRDIATGA
ncbi:MAG: DNA polymerase III subunit chi [Pseudomonadota bacterium]